jgi:hypothetical protein
MKRVEFFFLLSTLICTISCGDNNNGNLDDYYHPYAFCEGLFPNLPIGRELILVFNGDTLYNQTVEVVTRGVAKPQGVFTFNNVIKGEVKTVLTVDLIEGDQIIEPEDPDIIMVGNTKLLFEGVYSTKSRSIRYSGYIAPRLLLLELKE